ncbi:hypothetical protein [Pontibacter qinzhouensis]|uniref:hypothetical protein n=1 Tax=Pontibacter qinzhouensis TaxID=2603253 RepID=UPI00164F1943|nr:hypothetical protein [Pontibacter qinzhouensis]
MAFQRFFRKIWPRVFWLYGLKQALGPSPEFLNLTISTLKQFSNETAFLKAFLCFAGHGFLILKIPSSPFAWRQLRLSILMVQQQAKKAFFPACIYFIFSLYTSEFFI